MQDRSSNVSWGKRRLQRSGEMWRRATTCQVGRTPRKILHSKNILHDRVFAMPKTWPTLPPPLCSTRERPNMICMSWNLRWGKHEFVQSQSQRTACQILRKKNPIPNLSTLWREGTDRKSCSICDNKCQMGPQWWPKQNHLIASGKEPTSIIQHITHMW